MNDLARSKPSSGRARKAAAFPKRRALVLVNRKSRTGSGDIDAGLELMRINGIEVDLQHPEGPEQLLETIRAGASDHELIVLGGGDGTLSGAAPALIEAGLPVGILPLGTANDLARTLGIPEDLTAACRIIAEGRTRRIDLGTVNDRPFFNVASIGVSVRVARYQTPERKKRWKVLAYILSLNDAMRAARPFSVRLVCDGEERHLRCLQLSVGNGRFYGGGMSIAPDAEIDDETLRLYAILPEERWRLLSLLPALRSGRYQNLETVATFTAKEVEVTTSRSRRINADGELVAKTPARFAILPKALEVLVPRERPEAPGARGGNEDKDMNLIRDDLEVALNELLEHLRNVAEGYETAAEILQDAPEAERMAALGRERREAANGLFNALQEGGYEPKAADPERDLLRRAGSQAKAVFAESQAAALAEDRLFEENTVVDCAEAALQAGPPESIARLVETIRSQSREGIVSLEGFGSGL